MNRLLRICALSLVSGIGVTASADAQVMTVPLGELPPNQEMLVLDIRLEPGQESSPHRHNAHVFVYVLEGRVSMQVEGGELVTLSPGETFYESPGDVHSVSRNASETEPARFLVHMLKTRGAPVTVPARE